MYVHKNVCILKKTLEFTIFFYLKILMRKEIIQKIANIPEVADGRRDLHTLYLQTNNLQKHVLWREKVQFLSPL